MIEFIIVYFLTTALKFILIPFIILPIMGAAIAFKFKHDLYSQLLIFGIFILVGILITVFEYKFENFRATYLEKRMSINYSNFPQGMTQEDANLYWITYIPHFIIIFVLMYSSTIIFHLNFSSDLMFSFFTSALSVFLIAINQYVEVPHFSVNGDPPTPEKKFEIHEAAIAGDLHKVSILLQQKININQKTNKNMAPLHHAILANNFHMTKLLIESGADVNLLGDGFIPRTPLMFAAEKGNRNIIDLLLKHGADPHYRIHDGHNILYYAKENFELFDLFIQQGVDYKLIDQYGQSLLSTVSHMELDFKPHPLASAIVKYLLDLGVSPDGIEGERSRPLVEAVRTSNMEVVRLLIKHKADLNKKDNYNTTPLLAAIDQVNIDIVKLVLESGADVNLKGGTLNYNITISPLGLLKLKYESYSDETMKVRYKNIEKVLLQFGANLSG